MARNLAWRDLKTGTVAFGVIVAGALGVLIFARVGALHGDKSNIYVLSQEADGVLAGTEVWLSGQKIGLVKDIHFRAITTDTLERLAIHTEILSDRMHLVRRDAYADIRPGDNLIGSPIVFISSGTSLVPALRSGDTLVNVSTGKMKPVGEKVTELTARLSALADSGKRLSALLNSRTGTIGAFKHDGMAKMSDASATISGLMNKATTGNGTIALASKGDFGARLARIQAGKDSIVLLLSSGRGNIGRFKKDSTLFRTVSHIRDEIDSLKSMSSGAGTLQRARSDTALTLEMARIRVQLSELMADIKKHPSRYIAF